MEAREAVRAATQGIIIGYVIAWLLTMAGGEIIFLFSDAGRWFNSDTIPLQQSIEILITALYSPWTFILCVITIPGSIWVAVIGGWRELWSSYG